MNKSIKVDDFDPQTNQIFFKLIASSRQQKTKSDKLFGPDYCTSSKVVPHCTFKSALNPLKEVKNGRKYLRERK